MQDYRQMYQIMLTATEQAIDILTAAQMECEEIYNENLPPELELIFLPDVHRDNND